MRNRRLVHGRLAAAVLIGMAAASPAARAQNSGSQYEPELRQIVLEGKLDLTNYKPPNDDLAAFVASSGAELRLRIDGWDSKSRTFRFSFFLAQPGSPMSTPQLPDLSSPSMIVQGIGRAESIFHRQNDTGPAIGIAGRIAASLGGVGQASPSEVLMIGFTYPPEAFNPGGSLQATFREFSVLSPGVTNIYIPAATGSITVAPPGSK